jgi:hypothetical protein
MYPGKSEASSGDPVLDFFIARVGPLGLRDGGESKRLLSNYKGKLSELNSLRDEVAGLRQALQAATDLEVLAQNKIVETRNILHGERRKTDRMKKRELATALANLKAELSPSAAETTEMKTSSQQADIILKAIMDIHKPEWPDHAINLAIKISQEFKDSHLDAMMEALTQKSIAEIHALDPESDMDRIYRDIRFLDFVAEHPLSSSTLHSPTLPIDILKMIPQMTRLNVIKQFNCHGLNLFHRAAFSGNLDLLAYLCEQFTEADLFEILKLKADSYDKNPIEEAHAEGQQEALALFKSKLSPEHWSALMPAITENEVSDEERLPTEIALEPAQLYNTLHSGIVRPRAILPSETDNPDAKKPRLSDSGSDSSP